MLYTVFMEYRGGTYVSQVEADDVSTALRHWAAALTIWEGERLGAQRKAKLIRMIDEDLACGSGPVLLDGLVNAWCTTALLSRGGLLLINIVATARETSAQ